MDLGEALGSAAVILRRELVTFLRSRRAFWILCATVAGTGLLPLLSWPDNDRGGSAAVGRDGFTIYTMALLSALAAFVPLVTGAAITREREAGTLEELLGTRLSHAAIVYGKLFSSLSFFIVAISATVPMAAVAYLLGGIGFRQVLEGFLTTVSCSLLFGTVGIAFSIRARTTVRAVGAAYALLAPLFSLLLASAIAFAPEVSVISGPLLLLSALAATAALVMVHPASRLYIEEAPLLLSAPAVLSRRVRATLLRRGTLGVWSTPNEIPERWNPVFAAVIRRSITSRSSLPHAAALLTALVLFFLALHSVLVSSSGGFSFGCLALQAMTAYLLPFLGAGPLFEARRNGTLAEICATPLPARVILSGYLMAALFSARLLWVVAILFVLSCLPTAWWSGAHTLAPTSLALSLSLCGIALVGATCGLLGAVVFRNELLAIVLAYLLSYGLLSVHFGIDTLFDQPSWSMTAGTDQSLFPTAAIFLTLALATSALLLAAAALVLERGMRLR
jgi:ABC-type transport system involved in multi-copper enzyme maturation permease subunit